VSLHVELSERARGVDRRYLGAALARAMMLADDALVSGFRGFGAGGDRDAGDLWCTGDAVIDLKWTPDGARSLRTMLASKEFIKAVNREFAGWGALAGEWHHVDGTSIYEFKSPFAFDASVYCKARGLKYTMYRGKSGAQELQFAPDSLKKRVVHGISVAGERTGGSRAMVRAGPKFVAADFMRECFALPHPDEWVRTHAVCRRMSAG
jgi:hypothetical protein